MGLQGIGVLTIDNYYQNPFENEKGSQRLPDGLILFKQDTKTPEDDGLVAFIAKKSGKIKPLASADLDSFITNGKQLLYISKPFVIESLGTLYRNNNNVITFEQNAFVSLSGEEPAPRKKTLAATEEQAGAVNFDPNYLRPTPPAGNSTRKILIWGAAILGIAIIAWVAYIFLQQPVKVYPYPKTEPGSAATLDTSLPDPPDTTAAFSNPSLAIPTDSGAVASAPSITDTTRNSSYRLVLETAGRARAFKRYADLREWGHKVVMSTTDSVTFKLYIPMSGPLSDTTRNRDSLTRFFGRRATIELNP